MPSFDLLLYFQDHLTLQNHWSVRVCCLLPHLCLWRTVCGHLCWVRPLLLLCITAASYDKNAEFNLPPLFIQQLISGGNAAVLSTVATPAHAARCSLLAGMSMVSTTPAPWRTGCRSMTLSAGMSFQFWSRRMGAELRGGHGRLPCQQPCQFPSDHVGLLCGTTTQWLATNRVTQTHHAPAQTWRKRLPCTCFAGCVLQVSPGEELIERDWETQCGLDLSVPTAGTTAGVCSTSPAQSCLGTTRERSGVWATTCSRRSDVIKTGHIACGSDLRHAEYGPQVILNSRLIGDRSLLAIDPSAKTQQNPQSRSPASC
jgi:hypothetical protein